MRNPIKKSAISVNIQNEYPALKSSFQEHGAFFLETKKLFQYEFLYQRGKKSNRKRGIYTDIDFK